MNTSVPKGLAGGVSTRENRLGVARDSQWMRPRCMKRLAQWMAAVASLGLAFPGAAARAADFELSPAEMQRIDKDEIVIRATLDASARRGTVRAAMQIDAPPAVVFAAMTRCADAVKYVPHLRVCRIRDRAEDST